MPMKHSESPKRSGFTLIELLVVILIIAVLAGLIFPVMGKVKLRSIETRTTSNLRQIGTAMISYSNDHDSTLPGPLTQEQYPTFGLDEKRDKGSLAKLLSTYIGLSARKSADTEQASPTGVLTAPISNLPDGVKLDEIAGYIMNMEIVHDYEQPAWGEISDKEEKAPLTRAALSAWRNTAVDASTSSPTVNLTRKWAMRHTDQKDCKDLQLAGDWVDKLPKEPVFGYNESKPKEPGTYVTLFFDMHVEPAYKPLYEKDKDQQQATK